MKNLSSLLLLFILPVAIHAQTPATDIYDFIKKFITDSTGYENVGDWAVGNAKKFPVKWAADRVEMSEDTSINFFRKGNANILIHGKPLQGISGRTPIWEMMLKGPRMGYSSFSIISTHSPTLSPKYTIDSLFGKRPFAATLKKTCDNKPIAGFYYYYLKLPKKDPVYMKLSWLTINQNTAIRIDVYDTYSQYQAKLNCPN